MKNQQGDEEIIKKLYSYLTDNFRLEFKIKELLRNMLPEPENRWLKSIWKYGHADISVYRHGKLVCIIEPGGWFYHLKDKGQMLRDKKKDMLCTFNKINVLRIVNDVVENNLELVKTKQLFKKYFYKEE